MAESELLGAPVLLVGLLALLLSPLGPAAVAGAALLMAGWVLLPGDALLVSNCVRAGANAVRREDVAGPAGSVLLGLPPSCLSIGRSTLTCSKRLPDPAGRGSLALSVPADRELLLRPCYKTLWFRTRPSAACCPNTCRFHLAERFRLLLVIDIRSEALLTV